MHVQVAEPTVRLVMICAAVLALTAVVAGVVALVLNATGHTQFDMFGARFNTGNVGVAMVSMGIVSLMLTLQSVLKTVRQLAALPPDHLPPLTQARGRQWCAKGALRGRTASLISRAASRRRCRPVRGVSTGSPSGSSRRIAAVQPRAAEEGVVAAGGWSQTAVRRAALGPCWQADSRSLRPLARAPARAARGPCHRGRCELDSRR